MVEILVPIVSIIFAIGLPFLFVIKLEQGKHKERMAMIEKGIVDNFGKSEKRARKYNALRNGLVMIGVAIGAFAGFFVSLHSDTWSGGIAPIILAILGGGIAFVVYFFMARKMQKDDEENLLNE